MLCWGFFSFWNCCFPLGTCSWIHLLRIQIKEDRRRRQAIYRFTVDSYFNQSREFSGRLYTDLLTVSGRCWQRPQTRTGHATRTALSPVAPHRRDSALTGSQSYKTTRTYLTFSSKIHPVSFRNVCNATKPRKTHLSPPRLSVSPVVQYHRSLCSRFSRFSASGFCPDRPQMTAGLIRRTLVTSLQNRLFRARSNSLVHITECGLMTNERCSPWS